MLQLLSAALLVLILLASSAAGLYIRPLLSERHRSNETMDLVRLVTTMLVTFAALVLGLLTTSVKGAQDTVNADLRGFGVMIMRLDGALHEYGPQTEPVRAELRRYTAAVIASTWPGEPRPPGSDYPVDPQRASRDEDDLESPALGEMLAGIEHAIRRLQPTDAIQRKLADDCLRDFQRLDERRWKLIEEASSSISMPFYVVLVFWLAVVFASFGLCAPRNMLVYAILTLGAVSVASAIFVILVYDTPFTGIFAVSSGPLRAALAHLAR